MRGSVGRRGSGVRARPSRAREQAAGFLLARARCPGGENHWSTGDADARPSRAREQAAGSPARAIGARELLQRIITTAHVPDAGPTPG